MFMRKSTVIPKNICSQGFTLIEVMIGIAIFAIGILAVGSMQISASNKNAGARNYTTVITAAKDRAEELMALPYDDADLNAGEHSVSAGNLTQTTDGIDNDEDGQIDEAGEAGQVSIIWNVDEDQPLPGTKSVRVTVTRRVGSRQKSSTLDFIKANM